ncbi:MAG: SGNH/GDSL hydrolase family protein [Candidatus Binataceae bacterium]|nr:SGNH/GDSL hydrolase family protein [Candidatus Binataceae bacterium]
MRRLGGSVALIVAGVAAAVIIAEAALRLLPGHPNFYVYNRYVGWTLNPGVSGWVHEEGRAWLAVNRDGFRGPAVTRAKPPGTLRVAVLGDSFTEAQQVPYAATFCAVMQHKLHECAAIGGRPVQVLDFGVDGYGTTQELITMRRRVWRFHPDVIVLAFFAGNDPRNNTMALEGDQCRPFFVDRDGSLVLGGPFVDSAWFRFQCLLRFESRRSRVIAALSAAKVVIRDYFRARRKRSSPAGPVKGREPGISDLVYKPPVSAAWQQAWKVTEGQIAMMHREAAAHHAAFILVTLTSGIQVYPNPAVRSHYMRYVGVSDLFYPEQRLRALGECEHFAVLNLAEPMQQWADRQHAFLHGFRHTHMGNGHWNAAGHELGGTLMAQAVCGLISKPAPAKTSPQP